MIKWIPRLVAVRTIVHKAGVTTCRHRYYYVQAGYVQTGHLSVRLDDNHPLEIRPNEFYSIAQRQDHIIAVCRRHDTRSIDLRFQLVLDDSSLRRPRLAGQAGLREMAAHSFKIARPHARSLRATLSAMVDASRLAAADSRVLLVGIELLNLAAAIMDCPRQPRIALAGSPENPREVMQAIKLIHEQFARRLDVGDLAEKAGVSIGHLERLFRRFTGLGPKQYLLRYRVDQAKRLILAYDAISMKEVAYRTGFPDLQQFSRTFRRIEGCSPSHFLR